jgi:hypothetical protein
MPTLDLAGIFQVEITIPRVTGRQVYRMNIQNKSIEEY